MTESPVTHETEIGADLTTSPASPTGPTSPTTSNGLRGDELEPLAEPEDGQPSGMTSSPTTTLEIPEHQRLVYQAPSGGETFEHIELDMPSKRHCSFETLVLMDRPELHLRQDRHHTPSPTRMRRRPT